LFIGITIFRGILDCLCRTSTMAERVGVIDDDDALGEGGIMRKHYWFLDAASASLIGEIVAAEQYQFDPTADRVAERHPPRSSDQLAQKMEASPKRPKSAEVQSVLRMFRQNPKLQHFLFVKARDSVAMKMFECGVIP
jgi:hypothetical protein